MKTKITTLTSAILLMFFTAALHSCSGSSANSNATDSTSTSNDNVPADNNTKDIGIGPVKSVEIGPIDATKADAGKQLFESKCVACHKVTDERLVGPGLKGVTTRREPEWIMNQILNPGEMTQKDPIAKGLLETYLTQMTNQNVTEDQARNILEYFRQNDATK